MAGSGGSVRGVRAIGVTALILTIWACSPTLDWRENLAEGTGLVTMFPCRPDRHARALELAGAQVQMQMLVCTAGDATYAVSFFDANETGAAGPALAAMQAAMIAKIGNAAPVRVALRLPGATQLDQSTRLSVGGRRPDGRAVRLEAAFFAKGRRVYQAAIVGSALAEEAVDPFFTGLRLSD